MVNPRGKWVVLLVSACLLGTVGTLTAAPQDRGQKKKDGDNVNGTIWHYVLTHDNKRQSGQYRVLNYKIYRGKQQVGKILPNGAQTTLIIDGYPELNGKAELRRISTGPIVWKGHLKKDNGTRWEMEVTVKDR